MDNRQPTDTQGTIGAMRWTDLFDDLEAQLAAQEDAERRGEVAEHTRAAAGQVRLHHRFLADRGGTIAFTLRGGAVVEGPLAELGSDWLVVREVLPAHDREVLVVTANIVAIRGLTGHSDPGRGRGQRSLDLRHVLRALSRDRALVRVRDVDGGLTVGTIDRVGADHLDLSAHPDDLPRRNRDVHSVVTLSYAALASVTRA